MARSSTRSSVSSRFHSFAALAAVLLLLPACGGAPSADAVSADAIQPGKAECRRWTKCVPENPCHTGWVTGCRRNEPICTDIGGWLDNGTVCGDANVCYLGQCVPCAAGDACFPAKDPYGDPNRCQLGAIACATGQPVCELTGNAPNGSYCHGAEQPWYVCLDGQCNYCPAGMPCPPPAPCRLAAVSCKTGTPVCEDAGPAQDGTSCGPNGEICTDGTCAFPEGHLLVRAASGGFFDLTNTVWSECMWNEPAPGMSRLATDTYGLGTLTHTDRIFTTRLDCTGPEDPAQYLEVTGNVAAQGDRIAGWEGAPPSGLPTTVTATAVVMSGFGLPGEVRNLRFVDDRGNPRLVHEGARESAGPDGYPTNLRSGGRPGQGIGPCTSGLPCGTSNDGCLLWATQCFSGAPVCGPLQYAPDGASCGGGAGVCTSGVCGAPPPPTGIPVRALSGGLVDLAGTSWITCFPDEPAAGQSRKTTDMFLGATLVHVEETFPSATDCTGPVGTSWNGTMTVVTQGDRLVGWGPSAPPGLPPQVTATAITGTDPATGDPVSHKDIAFVDDLASPRVLYTGDDDPGNPTDPWGYPANLSPAGHVETPGACAGGAPCMNPANACQLATVSCAMGAPVCAGTGSVAADGAVCGPGLTCNLGQCLPAVTRTVTGARTLTFWPDGGPTAPQPAGLSSVLALVPTVLGGFKGVSGFMGPEGAITIPEVPEGRYLLDADIGYHVLVDTGASVVDLGEDRLGRASAAPGVGTAPAGTALELTLSGLQEWSAQDRLRIVASNPGLVKWAATAPPVSSALIAAGATTASLTPSWQGFPLLDGAQGDRAYVIQGATGTLPGTAVVYQAASRYGALPADLALVPGGSVGAAADLAPAPTDATLAATWPTAAYEAYAPALCGAPGTNPSHRLAVLAKPHAAAGAPAFVSPDATAGSAAVDLFWATVPSGTPPVEVATSYGRFLPAPWAEFLETRFSVPCPITVPNVPTAGRVAQVGRIDPIATAPAVPLPIVSPVTGVTIGGLDALAGGTGVGNAPEIAWTPPALVSAGTPVYTVTILKPFVRTGSTRTEFLLVAVARTAATRVKLPGILENGAWYFATIEVRVGEAESAESPLRRSFVAGYATVQSAPFQP